MYLKLVKICGRKNVKKNVSLKNFSTIKIGGNAKFVCYPNDKIKLINLVEYLTLKKIPYYVLGNGSNVLINSKGYNGVIIKLIKINEICEYENCVQVGSGACLGEVVNYFVNHGLKGMEQAVGIPGTMGGAVVMNAGAFNYETKNMVLGVTVLYDGKINYFNATECEFEYRKSVFTNEYIIVSVDLKKQLDNSNNLKSVMLETLNKRKNLPTQPSLGSVFKRNDNVIVSKLLDELGFKGKKVGGAMVSKQHAGIIVNTGNATSEDVKKLISEIKEECKNKTQEVLMEEIRYLN